MMSMLSKVSTLILGIIEERPVNPYEITKLLERIQVKNWFSVAASSVYVNIKKLQKNGYITGKTIKEGNMPEKTVYTINENGKTILKKTLIDFLLNTELDPVKFNIACMMLCHLEKDEALNVLKKRLLLLKGYDKGIKKHYKHEKDNHLIPYLGLTVIRHNIYLVESEIKITEELIAKVEKTDLWDYFISKDPINTFKSI